MKVLIMQSIRCAVIQYPIIWESPEANLKIYEEAIVGKSVDLVVLPEMFNTGFSNRVNQIAELINGISITWMREMSHTHSIAICGSLVIKENGQYYNRFVFVADDQVQFYDKRHLFSKGGEDKKFTPGTLRPIISWNSWKIFPIVCYDLRFPVWCRNDLDYDLMICVANWPTGRIRHWDQLLVARAIENQSFVIGCNRIGQDDNGLDYCGHSVAIDPWGDYILTPSGQQEVHTFSLDQLKINETRVRLPFLQDRDKFGL